MRFIIVAAILLGLGLSLVLPSGPAVAQGCTTNKFYHAGSVMAVKSCAGRLTITYKTPRQGLLASGVKSGTMLFTGSEKTNGSISGHVQIFQSGCGPIAFAVSGARKAGSIHLNGQLPARDSACKVVRKVSHAMVFTDQAGAAPGATAGAAAAGTGAGSSQPAVFFSPKVRAYMKKWDSFVKSRGIARLAHHRLNVPSCNGCVPFMIHCKKPLSSVADLRGKRVRTHSRKSARKLVRSAGGKPVVLAGGEIKKALQRGVIDCALSGGLRPK